MENSGKRLEIETFWAFFRAFRRLTLGGLRMEPAAKMDGRHIALARTPNVGRTTAPLDVQAQDPA